MIERRSKVRSRVLKGGKLTINQQGSAIECTVQNLSNSGACLQLSSTFDVPLEFDFSFDSFRTIRKCHVKWRTETGLGVAFQSSYPSRRR